MFLFIADACSRVSQHSISLLCNAACGLLGDAFEGFSPTFRSFLILVPLVLCRLQAQLQATESRAQEVERSVQAQLNALLNTLPASDVEPPRAFVSGLAELQTFAQGLEQRCKRLQDEAAAARRHAHLTCLSCLCMFHMPAGKWEPLFMQQCQWKMLPKQI